ncbi:hypothetical protein KIN20_032259 [Parelaphostrongylus tenuis]|uniref:Peptidase A1 domain-containing protein n=1 Tax=Parelaphostrongylus tenuis TaxID=148309 RepID=A0AAD5R6C9_PARTN|nr:hypothetical protein KIN20_032259 [Parelaphostrongylus tenuis]
MVSPDSTDASLIARSRCRSRVKTPRSNSSTEMDGAKGRSSLILFLLEFNHQLNANPGLITFGAIDTVNCHSDINYVPLTSETYWQFAIDGFSIGNYSEHKIEQVVAL